MSDRFSLKGKIALAIGGGSGIGRQIALGFADAGATVLPAGRRKEKVDAVADEIKKAGGQAQGYAVDATDTAALRDCITQVVKDHGRIDLLLNSQGTTRVQPALDFTEEQYDEIMNTNLRSVFFSCQEVGRHMIEQGSGAIINIASLSSYRGFRNASVYSMTKWGVVSLTETLAVEWAESGVRVNAIAPGYFMTDLNRERMSDDRKQHAISRTPMKRFGELEELVGAAIYLASDAAKFVTGETIRVDGGFLAMGI